MLRLRFWFIVRNHWFLPIFAAIIYVIIKFENLQILRKIFDSIYCAKNLLVLRCRWVRWLSLVRDDFSAIFSLPPFLLLCLSFYFISQNMLDNIDAVIVNCLMLAIIHKHTYRYNVVRIHAIYSQTLVTYCFAATVFKFCSYVLSWLMY